MIDIETLALAKAYVNKLIELGLDYNSLQNKPQIESVTLQGNKTFADLNLNFCTDNEITAIVQSIS